MQKTQMPTHVYTSEQSKQPERKDSRRQREGVVKVKGYKQNVQLLILQS